MNPTHLNELLRDFLPMAYPNQKPTFYQKCLTAPYFLLRSDWSTPFSALDQDTIVDPRDNILRTPFPQYRFCFMDGHTSLMGVALRKPNYLEILSYPQYNLQTSEHKSQRMGSLLWHLIFSHNPHRGCIDIDRFEVYNARSGQNITGLVLHALSVKWNEGRGPENLMDTKGFFAEFGVPDDQEIWEPYIKALGPERAHQLSKQLHKASQHHDRISRALIDIWAFQALCKKAAMRFPDLYAIINDIPEKDLEVVELKPDLDLTAELQPQQSLMDQFSHQDKKPYWYGHLKSTAAGLYVVFFSASAEFFAPFNFPVRIRPDKCRSVEWLQAHEHYTIVHRHHPANKKHAHSNGHLPTFSVSNDETLQRMAHSRRAHTRILRSPRFIHKQGQRVAVKACWVGPIEWRDAGGKQIYKICELAHQHHAF